MPETIDFTGLGSLVETIEIPDNGLVINTTKSDTKSDTQVDTQSTKITTETKVENNDLIDTDSITSKIEEAKIDNVDDITKEDKTVIENTEVPNLYTALGEMLKESGVLQVEDGVKFETPEDIQNAVVKQSEVIHEEWKDSLPPVIKHLIDNYEEDVPLDQLINIKSNQIRYSGITEDKLSENVETQKAVYAEYLRNTTKYSETKINKEVQRLEDLEELATEAKDALNELKTIEAEKEVELVELTKKEKAEQVKQQTEYTKKIEDTINITKEIIPGVLLSDKDKKDIKKFMTTPVAVDNTGKPISKVQEIQAKDPIKFNMMLNYFATKGFFEGNFEAITTKAKTNAIKELEKTIESQAKAFKTGGKDNISTKQGSGIMDSLRTLKK